MTTEVHQDLTRTLLAVLFIAALIAGHRSGHTIHEYTVQRPGARPSASLRTSSGLPRESRDPGGVPVNVALQVLGGVVAGDIAVRVDHALPEMDIRLRLAECRHVEIAKDAAKVL